MASKSLQVGGRAFEAPEVGHAVDAGTGAATSLSPAPSRLRAGPAPKRVGFIGLDDIGQKLASRLLMAGHRLTLYDPILKIPGSLELAGGQIANNVEDVCRWADAVFTMLPDEEVTESVILGPGGVLEWLPSQAIHVGSSAVSVECSDRLVEAHWDAGKEYVSAPLLVPAESAEEVRLLVIAGGRPETISEIEPLLREFGHLVQFNGWPSNANLVQVNANARIGDCLGFSWERLELGVPSDRWQLGSPAFLDAQANLDI